MSRAHMLYDDKAIKSVINVKWKGKWQEESVFRFSQAPGAMIEGTVKGKARLAVIDSSGKDVVYHHYAVVQLEFKKGFKRIFDDSGDEIEPWKTSTKKINTGYLMSSYKTVAVETSAINSQEIVELARVAELDVFLPEHLKSAKSVVFFYNESTLRNLEANIDDCIRVKTKGNGPYVEYLAKVDLGYVSSSEYESGASSQGSWTDKIMSLKGKQDEAVDQPDGVDESEWDD